MRLKVTAGAVIGRGRSLHTFSRLAMKHVDGWSSPPLNRQWQGVIGADAMTAGSEHSTVVLGIAGEKHWPAPDEALLCIVTYKDD